MLTLWKIYFAIYQIMIYLINNIHNNKKNWKHEFHNILQGDQLSKKYSYVSWWMQFQYDVGIAFKFHDFVQVTFYHWLNNFVIPSFTWINMSGMIDLAWNKYFFKCYFVSWFLILSQNDACIVFLLGFARAM